MKSRLALPWFSLIALLAVVAGAPRPARAAWQLVWSDEFAQADGTSPDSSKWNYDIGNGSSGWGNNEWEYYTSRTNNARIQSEQLVIEARNESYGGYNYTSARLLTRGKWSWAYGRIEASIKLPRGQGIWPAFWMLGTNIDSVSWPTCGEIDIMENIGKASDQGTVHATLHGPQSGGDYNGGAGVGGSYTLPGGAILGDAFHVFAIEWTTNQIKWFLDNTNFYTATPASLPGGATWVFSQPQFLLLNVAVGGRWPGYPDATTVFPQQMLVDYVRVYKYVATPPSAPTGLSAGLTTSQVFLSWDAPASGASGYRVKRATSSGGPYTVIGATANSSYVDPGVAGCASYYYVVSATNSAGESADSGEVSAVLGAYALAVNPGGGAAAQFAADASYNGGQAATTTSVIDTSGVTGPAPQAVYQSERYGTCNYVFGGLIPGAEYQLRLHFAEFYWTAVGQRRFNVLLNNTQVLTNFDIIAAAGAAKKANIQEFSCVANPSGQISVQFNTVTDNAKCSGIELLLPRPSGPAATNNGPIVPGMNLKLTASTIAGATYSWTGPNGFSSTNQNPILAAASPAAAGLYSVVANVGGCPSPVSTTLVTVQPPVQVSLSTSNQVLILQWPAGILQSANSATGSWADVIPANSPWLVLPSAPQQYFRLRLAQ